MIVQGSSRALAAQGEQGILGFSNPSYLTNPAKLSFSSLSLCLDQFSIILCLRISLNFTLHIRSSCPWLKVVHGKKGHGICSLGSETIENIKN